MASKAQIMWVDFAFNAMPDEFQGDANVWYQMDENDPQWDTHFRPALGRGAQALWLRSTTEGPKGDPGATVEQVTSEIVRRLGNG